MMRFTSRVLLSWIWLILVAPVLADEISLVEGSGSFVFVDQRGDPSRPMEVFTYVPPGVDVKGARLVFTMHGVSKNAAGMRDSWIPMADEHQFVILAPRFSKELWPRGQYSYSSVLTPSGQHTPKENWSYSVIEHLFDAVRQSTGNLSSDYLLYGHSEGGQFVHRLVLMLPDARYRCAIAANAGWYTLPDLSIGYPYGLKQSPADQASLIKSLKRNVVVLLGEKDTDPNHHQLRNTPQAKAQGASRYERGQTFFNTARQQAVALNGDFGWRLRTVPDAAHENAKMARAASAIFRDE